MKSPDEPSRPLADLAAATLTYVAHLLLVVARTVRKEKP